MKKMRKKFQFLCVACMCLSVLTPYTSAGTVTGTSVAEHYMDVPELGGAQWTFADGSTYEYKYTIDLSWDYSEMAQALSHFDLGFSTTLLCDYALFDAEGGPTGNIRFEDAATYVAPSDGLTYFYDTGVDGYSNSEELPADYRSVQWGGYIDAILGGSGATSPLIIRYQQPLEYNPLQPDAPAFGDPGKVGAGQFWFYSHFAPIVSSGDITMKIGSNEIPTVDALTGDMPFCDIPEPATLALLGLGGLLLRRRRA